MPKKSFVAEQAASLRAVAAATKYQADLLSKHKWSDLDWGWLERKNPIEDVDRLYEVAQREDKRFKYALGKPEGSEGTIDHPTSAHQTKQKRQSFRHSRLGWFRKTSSNYRRPLCRQAIESSQTASSEELSLDSRSDWG